MGKTEIILEDSYKLCACGCGQKVTKLTNQFINGHVIERIRSFINESC